MATLRTYEANGKITNGVLSIRYRSLFDKALFAFGDCEADHIITMLTSRTNIKPCTLESKGFKMLEVLYRLEVSQGVS